MQFHLSVDLDVKESERSLTRAKYKGKSTWVIPKIGRDRLRELFIRKSQFKRGSTKMVVTRAGRLREWSQGELRLHMEL